MASKWMTGKEKLFTKFKEEQEEQKQSSGYIDRMDMVWKTPEKGTVENAKTYTGRMLLDPNDVFYKTFYYHMYKNSKDEWVFVLCPTTFDKKAFCPHCVVNRKLFKGTEEDKKMGYKYKRNVKYCVNFYITDDPRDNETDDENKINKGKVKIYEFPKKVETKIDKTLHDKKNGVGIKAFDPSDEGYDFILNVLSTKPLQKGPNAGATFPDYSISEFARNPYAIGTDVEIDEIMSKRHDLNEYLVKMKRTDEELKELIKDELLFDLVEEYYADEAEKATEMITDLLNKDDKPKPKEDDIDDSKFVDPIVEDKKEEVSDFNDETSDEDLLADIENMLAD